MEVRLNKLISDSGLCSRREADKFIEEGRVTVNGSLPQVGQESIRANKHLPHGSISKSWNLPDKKKRRRRQSLCLRRLPKRRRLLLQPVQKAYAPANM